jgi:hypothetical protein
MTNKEDRKEVQGINVSQDEILSKLEADLSELIADEKS